MQGCDESISQDEGQARKGNASWTEQLCSHCGCRYDFLFKHYNKLCSYRPFLDTPCLMDILQVVSTEQIHTEIIDSLLRNEFVLRLIDPIMLIRLILLCSSAASILRCRRRRCSRRRQTCSIRRRALPLMSVSIASNVACVRT